MRKTLFENPLKGLIVMGLLILGGCVSLLPEAGAPATKYTLKVPQRQTLKRVHAQHPPQEILKVVTPLCEQSLRTSRILVLHEEPGITRSDFLADALWSESLPDLVHQRLIQYLSLHGPYKSVVQADESVDVDLSMITTIEAFELIRSLDQKMYARVTMTFKIVEAKTHKLIKHKSFSKEVLLKTMTQQESLSALQLAFVGVLEEMGAWVNNSEIKKLS